MRTPFLAHSIKEKTNDSMVLVKTWLGQLYSESSRTMARESKAWGIGLNSKHSLDKGRLIAEEQGGGVSE